MNIETSRVYVATAVNAYGESRVTCWFRDMPQGAPVSIIMPPTPPNPAPSSSSSPTPTVRKPAREHLLRLRNGGRVGHVIVWVYRGEFSIPGPPGPPRPSVIYYSHWVTRRSRTILANLAGTTPALSNLTSPAAFSHTSYPSSRSKNLLHLRRLPAHPPSLSALALWIIEYCAVPQRIT